MFQQDVRWTLWTTTNEVLTDATCFGRRYLLLLLENMCHFLYQSRHERNPTRVGRGLWPRKSKGGPIAAENRLPERLLARSTESSPCGDAPEALLAQETLRTAC